MPTGDREKMNTRESEQQSGYKPHSVSHVTNTHDTKVAVYNKLFKSNIRGDMRLSDGSTTLHKECFRNHTSLQFICLYFAKVATSEIK